MRVGKLNAWAPDSCGVRRRVVIPNVRCVPAFTDTLLSVDDLWQLSQLAAVFQNTQQVEQRTTDGEVMHSWPFSKRRGLYVWDLKVDVTAAHAGKAYEGKRDGPTVIAHFTKELAQRIATSIAEITAARAAAALTGNGTHSARSTSHIYSTSTR